MLLVDGGGEPVQANLYGAFGEVLRAWGDSRNDRLGNTKEYDRATGLANHGLRYYDPATGRYLSEDPLGYEGGFNLHVYCGNDPVNKFDPLGLRDNDREAELRKQYELVARSQRDIERKIAKLNSGRLSPAKAQQLRQEIRGEYKKYLNDLGKSGKLAKTFIDSKWIPLAGDYELAGRHASFPLTFEGMDLAKGNQGAIAKQQRIGEEFGSSLDVATSRTAAALWTAKGTEYAGEAAELAMMAAGAGVAFKVGKVALKQGVKEASVSGITTLVHTGSAEIAGGLACSFGADMVVEAGMDRDNAERVVKGIHGILSLSGATRLKKLVKLRGEYEAKVRAIAGQTKEHIANGQPIEDAARSAFEMRNALKEEFRAKTSRALVNSAKSRNKAKYDNTVSASFENLMNKKSYQEIIEGASSPGGEDMGTDILRFLNKSLRVTK